MATVQVSQEKQQAVQETVELLNRYEIVAAADLYKVGSGMLQDVRRQLRDQLTVKCVKNTLMRISMEAAEKEGAHEFMDSIAGPNVFLFTNGNPFKLAMMLDANKVQVFAKAGDIALGEIVIKAGNTGLSPGPIISKFGALGIRTRIEAGNIWINQDATVAKAGDEISGDLADLLSRMGIKAAEMGLSIKAVYERGTIIPGEALILDLGQYRSRLEQAYGNAFQVAIHTAYPTPATVPVLLAKAAQEARSVAVEAGYATKDTIMMLIAKASTQAKSLASRVGEIQAQN